MRRVQLYGAVVARCLRWRGVRVSPARTSGNSPRIRHARGCRAPSARWRRVDEVLENKQCHGAPIRMGRSAALCVARPRDTSHTAGCIIARRRGAPRSPTRTRCAGVVRAL